MGLAVNKPYRLVPLARIILLKLYVQYVNDEPKVLYSVEDVIKLFDASVSKNLVNSALEYLRTVSYKGPVSRGKDKKTGRYVYKITNEGILTVEKHLRVPTSDLAYIFAHGDSVLDEVAGVDSRFAFKGEEIDTNAWPLIEVDEKQPEYVKALEALDQAVGAIEKDNQLGAEFPEEKEGILKTVKDASEHIKTGPVSSQFIRSCIIDPLLWVANKFPNAVLGELSKKAAQQFIDWLGTYF